MIKVGLDCLWIWVFFSHSWIFHLYGDLYGDNTITDEGLQIVLNWYGAPGLLGAPASRAAILSSLWASLLVRPPADGRTGLLIWWFTVREKETPYPAAILHARRADILIRVDNLVCGNPLHTPNETTHHTGRIGPSTDCRPDIGRNNTHLYGRRGQGTEC